MHLLNNGQHHCWSIHAESICQTTAGFLLVCSLWIHHHLPAHLQSLLVSDLLHWHYLFLQQWKWQLTARSGLLLVLKLQIFDQQLLTNGVRNHGSEVRFCVQFTILPFIYSLDLWHHKKLLEKFCSATKSPINLRINHFETWSSMQTESSGQILSTLLAGKQKGIEDRLVICCLHFTVFPNFLLILSTFCYWVHFSDKAVVDSKNLFHRATPNKRKDFFNPWIVERLKSF